MYVKSISYNQHQIIKWILQLHCEGDIELDPTYSTGGFYKQGVREPKFKFDIQPVKPGVIAAAAEALPLRDNSIKTMIFDPPFLATKGKSLDGILDVTQNKTVRRFGWYASEKELFAFYKESLIEFKRILEPKGVLIFKCQDKVSGGKQYMSHNFIIKCAEELGFYTKDLFVLLSKNRMVPKWQTLNQQHARKFHSYFLVFENAGKSISYL
jgi:hypothetical protein